MASDWPNDPDNVLRGLFGTFISASEQGLDTQGVWAGLRDAASIWASGVLGVTSAGPPSEEEINAAASQLLGGVTIQAVSKYRSLAGAFVQAHENLLDTDLYAQIEGNAVFRPPWANTIGNPAVPERYRLTVQRSITVFGFTQIQRTEWATYELASPLTSLQDAFNAANTAFNAADYNSRARIDSILDYNIQAV